MVYSLIYNGSSKTRCTTSLDRYWQQTSFVFVTSRDETDARWVIDNLSDNPQWKMCPLQLGKLCLHCALWKWLLVRRILSLGRNRFNFSLYSTLLTQAFSQKLASLHYVHLISYPSYVIRIQKCSPAHAFLQSLCCKPVAQSVVHVLLPHCPHSGTEQIWKWR